MKTSEISEKEYKIYGIYEMAFQIITFLAGILIALITTFFAFKFSRHQEYLKQKQIYIKALSIIDANLDWHFNQIQRLSSSLVVLEESSIIDKKITINEFPVNFNITILQKQIEYLIEYKECSELLIKTLTFYMNHIEELKYQLEFSNANKIIETLKNPESIDEGIRKYFESIQNDYIEKIRQEIKISKTIILTERNKNAR